MVCFQVLPNQEGISWESHLYGALMGIFVSFYFKDDLERDEEESLRPFLKKEEYYEKELNIFSIGIRLKKRNINEE